MHGKRQQILLGGFLKLIKTLDLDIIFIDPAKRFFKMKHASVRGAISRGVYFEVSLASALGGKYLMVVA